MNQGADLVMRTLEGLADGSLKPKSQEEFMKPGEILKTAPKIFPEDCIINWDNSPDRIHNFIRGLSPDPCARSEFKNDSRSVSFKIFESSSEIAEHSYNPAEIVSDGKSYIKVACRGGFINILSLQPESKKRMSAGEFLRGFRINGFSVRIS
jgi:methionyl-tRNA formyltransferase